MKGRKRKKEGGGSESGSRVSGGNALESSAELWTFPFISWRLRRPRKVSSDPFRISSRLSQNWAECWLLFFCRRFFQFLSAHKTILRETNTMSTLKRNEIQKPKLHRYKQRTRPNFFKLFLLFFPFPLSSSYSVDQEPTVQRFTKSQRWSVWGNSIASTALSFASVETWG